MPDYLIKALRGAEAAGPLRDWRLRASGAVRELVGAELQLTGALDDGAPAGLTVPTYPYVTIGTWDGYGRQLAAAFSQQGDGLQHLQRRAAHSLDAAGSPSPAARRQAMGEQEPGGVSCSGEGSLHLTLP